MSGHRIQSVLVALLVGVCVGAATHYLGYDRDMVLDSAGLAAFLTWLVT
jgi:hypothetical protein